MNYHAIGTHTHTKKKRKKKKRNDWYIIHFQQYVNVQLYILASLCSLSFFYNYVLKFYKGKILERVLVNKYHNPQGTICQFHNLVGCLFDQFV
jgi:hypothetical protein